MSQENKVMVHAKALKVQRIKSREKNMKYAPGIVTLQVLGSGAKGTPKSLYLFTDQSRYLFNCGEGTQRLAHELKMRLSKLDSLFITYPVWENVGGLPGLALTIQDNGVPEILIHGPDGLDEIFIGTRRFVVLKNLTVATKECLPYEKFEDHILTVIYVPINESDADKSESSPASTNVSPTPSEDDDIDYYDYETQSKQSSPNKKKRGLSPTSGPQKDSKKRKSSGRGKISMSYICQLRDRPGALSLEKCVAHKVPPGPLFGQLKAGKDITLQDGTVVKSSDVTEPDQIGPVFIIVDCPNEKFLDNFLNEKSFEKYQGQSDSDKAYVIAHFSPADIIRLPRYKAWMKKFGETTQHLFLNETNYCMGSTSVHRIQSKLNLLSNDIFPMLNDIGIPLQTESGNTASPENSLPERLQIPEEVPPEIESAINEIHSSQLEHYSRLETKLAQSSLSDQLSDEFSVIPARSLTKIPLRPLLDVDKAPQILLNTKEYIKEAMTDEVFYEALQNLKHNLENFPRNKNDREFPQVIFLGTGSSIPNKTRNTSGILLRLDEHSCMLLDCAEGTYTQLVRLFGDEVTSILSQLKAIYISHLHADHHLGTISIIKAKRQLGHDKLYLLAPKQIVTWLTLYHNCFENINLGYQLVPLQNFQRHGQNRPKLEVEDELVLQKLGLQDVTTTLVRHCANAFGVALITQGGHKITYSGDTMPCDSLVQIGKNSDLLIHEATHEDELENEAKLKMHSTVSQAIKIGEQMRAKYVMLTHFSQRYAKLPRLNFELNDNVGIAFDNMRVSLSNLPKLKLFYPALKALFAEEQDAIEVRAFKRSKKQELRRKSLED